VEKAAAARRDACKRSMDVDKRRALLLMQCITVELGMVRPE
jgi:hypothetical protein